MSQRLWVSTRKGLFSFRRDSGWTLERHSFPGHPAVITLPDPRDGKIYTTLNLGHFGVKLHRSEDQGATWREIPAPAYPPKPENVPDIICPMRKKAIPWSLELIWSLEPGGTDQPGTLWCGTIPGGLFRSDDHGENWRLIRSLWDRPERAKWMGGGYDYPGIHSICVHPRNSNHILLAISCGGVWLTQDGGETWAYRTQGMKATYVPPELGLEPDIQDPHRMVQCPADPRALWIQHHNGIFRSTDGAENWQHIQNVQPSSFGFAVAVHPQKPDTAWFVPAHSDEQRIPVDGKITVTRTTDGGKSFTPLTRGLPQQHAYDLCYRHCLDIASDGNTLALGSTTGSLWLTENGGDSWQELSAHLPPINAVRFG